LESHEKDGWKAGEAAIGSVLKDQPEWDEGHQLRIELWERRGQLSQLEEVYRAEGLRRWADLVHLVFKFKGDDSWKRKDPPGWQMNIANGVILVLAGVLWVLGWMTARGATQENGTYTLYMSLTLMTGGLMLLLLFVWSLRKKFSVPTPDPNTSRLPPLTPDSKPADSNETSDASTMKQP